ncbi:hypothetical protein EVAR_3907_1 [Eumeta japonica]|uniref:DUF4780 domain-containing protein n=1 Tax=Eumeta variegata TaxID=151549 RepID=A0A4C1SRF5_EUMVA|nr:hypothetical protein EVAR_3907_1 [Eumeta japonica]
MNIHRKNLHGGIVDNLSRVQPLRVLTGRPHEVLYVLKENVELDVEAVDEKEITKSEETPDTTALVINNVYEWIDAGNVFVKDVCQDFPELHIKFHANYVIPELVKCSISVPTYSDTVWVVHQKLNFQNSEYDIDSWYYITHEKMENPHALILKYYVPKEVLEEIKNDNFKLSFGFGCAILNVDPN